MEDEAIHIVMEYAEQGDLYKVSPILTYKCPCLDVERSENQEEVFLGEGLVGLRISDMYGGGVPSF